METPGAAGGGVPSSTMRIAPRTRSTPSCDAVDAERLAEAARARRRGRGRGAPSTRRVAHHVEPVERRGRAQQHRVRLLARAAHRVHAPVVAVGEVHVQVAGRAEHRRVARRRAAVRVAAGIVGAAVRLDLDDARREPRPVAGRTSTLLSSSRRDARARRGRRTSAAACSGSTREPARCSLQPVAGRLELRGDRLRAARRPASCAGAPRCPARAAPAQSGPRRGSFEHELVERHAALDRLPHERADDRVRLAERRALLARDARRGRSPRSIGLSAAAVIAVVDELDGREQPGRARAATARTCRARRTAAPCPPAGRGCTRAAGP